MGRHRPGGGHGAVLEPGYSQRRAVGLAAASLAAGIAVAANMRFLIIGHLRGDRRDALVGWPRLAVPTTLTVVLIGWMV